jgi:hypothetical protein
VYFGCDPVRSPVADLLVEVGYGHGGSLQLWELSRTDDSAESFQVIAVANDTYYGSATIVDGKPEIEPPPSPTMHLSMSTSSGNFHHRIAITEDGHDCPRCAGGEGSSAGDGRREPPAGARGTGWGNGHRAHERPMIQPERKAASSHHLAGALTRSACG